MKIRRNSHYGESPIACPDGTRGDLGQQENKSRAFFWRAREARFLLPHLIKCCFKAAKEVFMKKKVVSLVSLVSAVLALFSLVALAGCKKSPVTADENTVVIQASAEHSGKTLLAVMEELQEAGELSFAVSDGMIVELNGTKQTASSYWMLYTSDKESANEQWGTFEYEGEVLGSAVSGAGELAVKEGCLYIWAFESFGI